MRTLEEIIEDAKDGQMPSHEECYYAMLTFEALMCFDHRALRNVVHKPRAYPPPGIVVKESFHRLKAALSRSPKEWIGPEYDPKNHDYQQMRKAAIRFYDVNKILTE